MKEKFPSQEKPIQDVLKAELLAGNIPADVFLKKVAELDQSNPQRSESERNAMLLSDPVVRKALEEEEGIVLAYNHLLSLSEFHVGQRLMQDPESARPHVEAALSAAEKIQDPDYKQWKLYVLATLAYLDKKLEVLKSIHSDLEEGRNKEIVGNMIDGLQSSGGINYKRDYEKS